MQFLAAVTFLLYVNLIASVRALKRGQTKWGASHFAVAMIGSWGGLLGFGILNGLTKNTTINQHNWCVLLFFIVGGGTAILFGIKLFYIFKNKVSSTPSWRYGVSIWAVVAGLYVSGAVVDHWVFFSDEEHAGIAAADLLGAKDVQCSSMVFVRITPQTAVYRCPKTFVLGQYTGKPFAPWPSYEEGESVTLKNRIEAMYRETAAQEKVAK
jgi:hypothetical protein